MGHISLSVIGTSLVSCANLGHLPNVAFRALHLHAPAFLSFGAAFTPFYRLIGPFAHSSAPETVRTELWDTIARRGILGNLAMGIIPMIFYGIVNAFALWSEIVWVLLGRPGRDFYCIPPGYLG